MGRFSCRKGSLDEKLQICMMARNYGVRTNLLPLLALFETLGPDLQLPVVALPGDSLCRILPQARNLLWVSRLDTHLSNAGLDIEAKDRIPVPPEYKMLFNLSHLITLEDVATAKAPDGSNDMLHDLKGEFLDNGVSIDQIFICILARRRQDMGLTTTTNA
ncbi:MAG: hypothetical protein Q9172_005913 [Xanthocarpia lactea]